MPNIFHQSVEDILKTASPEQKIIWNYLFLRYGERIPISQFYYQGPTSGEIATYSARKLYFATQLIFTAGNAHSASSTYLQLYDDANANYINLGNQNIAWDVTAAQMRYIANSFQLNNVLFSRIVGININTVVFVGYRIGI